MSRPFQFSARTSIQADSESHSLPFCAHHLLQAIRLPPASRTTELLFVLRSVPVRNFTLDLCAVDGKHLLECSDSFKAGCGESATSKSAEREYIYCAGASSGVLGFIDACFSQKASIAVKAPVRTVSQEFSRTAGAVTLPNA
eukprot:5855064-Pleurochrysis_carterae.AAC.2